MTDRHELTRRQLIGAAGGAAAVGVLGPGAASAAVRRNRFGGDLPLNRIGIQLFTVRDLLADNELDMPRTFQILRDAGYAELELGGDYDGRPPSEVRRIAEAHGLKVASNHFGPRALVQNTWYDPNERGRFFQDAHALGLRSIGTGHSYVAPRTVEGYKEMAAAFNVWGEDAVRNGFRYFFFHNHDVEFTRVNGKPLFDILLAETDPRYVKFELDLGWMFIAGEDPYPYIRRDPDRFPMFHVKDIRWNPYGPRVAAEGTVNGGNRFSFANLGKGVIDYPRIFSALKNPNRHHYFAEHDDAGNDETLDATSPPPRNPAGSAHTAWVSRKYLANLKVRRRPRR